MLKIAWFSPINSISKSACFTAQLRPLLEKNYEIDFFVNQDEAENKRVFNYLRAFSFQQTKKYDCFVYQLEDSSVSSFIQRQMKLMPGIVLFHDLNFNHLYLNRFKHETSETLLNQEMDQLFGEDSVRLGGYKTRGWSLDIFDSIYVRSKKEINNSVISVVQTESQRQYFLKESEQFVEKISLIESIEQIKISVDDLKKKFRSEFSIKDHEMLISFSESVAIRDRLSLLLEAVESAGIDKFCLLCIARGLEEKLNYEKFFSRDEIKEKKIKYIIKEVNNLEGFLKEHLVSDINFSLNNDLLRGMPLATAYCLANGVAVVSGPLAWAKDLPNDICFKIDLGFPEKEELALLLKEISNNNQLLNEVSRNAKNYCTLFWGKEKVFTKLQEMIERSSFKLKNLVQEKVAQYNKTKSEILLENSLHE